MARFLIRGAGVLLALIGLVHAGAALAHGKAASMQEDFCSRQVAGHLVHFAVYMPDIAPSEVFCDNIPKRGEAILVMDLVDFALRQVPIEMRVVRDGEDLDQGTVAHVPARTYPHGSVRADAELDPGHYYIVVNAGGPQPFTYQYGVWVERPEYGRYALLTFGALLAAFGVYRLSRAAWVQRLLTRPKG
jgi:hypothetical protein